MRIVEFEVDLYDEVVLPTGDKGVVTMLGIDESCPQAVVAVVGQADRNWWPISRLNPAPTEPEAAPTEEEKPPAAE